MNTIHNIRIYHDEHGEILNMEFTDSTQMKLFIKMIHSSLELSTDFRYYDADCFFVSIPLHILTRCLITTDSKVYKLSNHLKNKLKEVSK